MLHAHLDMGSGTIIHPTILSEGTLTVILHVVMMIEKSHMVMLSIEVQI